MLVGRASGSHGVGTSFAYGCVDAGDEHMCILVCLCEGE